jgi:8-oxo-dGTP pyrophosphatase MutT (NUDIX family)
MFSIAAAIMSFCGQHSDSTQRRDIEISPDTVAAAAVQKLRHLKVVSKSWQYTGNWIRTGLATYNDWKGGERQYETVERTTRKGDLDGVDVLAFLTSSRPSMKGKYLILVLAYRPPVDHISVEFPAGLVEENETAEEAGLRELREETGFVGTATGNVSPELFCDPWKSNENTKLVTVIVDGDDERNYENTVGLGQMKKLDEAEFLDVLVVPVQGLLYRLNRYIHEMGFGVDGKLYTFALALELSQTWQRQLEQNSNAY